MELSVGQKVAYPGQGVCLVEEIGKRSIGGGQVRCYLLRVLGDNSHIVVPTENAEAVGIRPVISSYKCRQLIDRLAEDFDDISADWKSRSKQFTEKLQSGDVFEAADVLKKLTYLSHEKKLSFRERTLLEKARFLIISEITYAGATKVDALEQRVVELVEAACSKHVNTMPVLVSAAVH